MSPVKGEGRKFESARHLFWRGEARTLYYGVRPIQKRRRGINLFAFSLFESWARFLNLISWLKRSLALTAVFRLKPSECFLGLRRDNRMKCQMKYQFTLHRPTIAVALVSALTLVACQRPHQSARQELPLGFQAFKALEDSGVIAQPADPGNCTEAVLAAPKTTCKSLRQEFRYIVYVGKQIYAYWDLKKTETGTDFDALALNLEAKITDHSSLSQYFAEVLRPWAASLHDGHVNAMAGDDMSALEVLSPGVKLSVLAAGTDHEKVVVASSKQPNLPEKSIITKINGVDTAQALTTLEAAASGSTRRMRRFFGGARALDAMGAQHAKEALEIEFIPPKETAAKTVSLRRKFSINLAPLPGATPTPDTTGEELVRAEVLPNGIGFLKIDGFVGTRIADVLDQAMSRLKVTDGLIIDLRSNGGGDQSGDRILRWLSEKSITRYFTSPRRSDYLLSARSEYALLAPSTSEPDFYEWVAKTVAPTEKSEGTYAGKPVVVMISPNCFSACDTFVAAIKANNLATIVGEATGGGTGTPLVFELPVSAMKFRYSVVRGMTALKTRIEGVGTEPDIVAEMKYEDLGLDATADSQTLKAIEVISQKLGTGPGSLPVAASPGAASAPTRSVYSERFKDVSATVEELLRLKDLSSVREDD